MKEMMKEMVEGMRDIRVIKEQGRSMKEEMEGIRRDMRESEKRWTEEREQLRKSIRELEKRMREMEMRLEKEKREEKGGRKEE